MSPEYWLKRLAFGLTVSLVLFQAQVGRSQLRIDTPSASAPGTAISREEADLTYARNQYVRYQYLYREGAVTRQQLDQAENNYKFAQAQYNQRQQPQRLQRSESRQTALQAELAQAEADVQLKQLVYNRYQTLYREGAIGRSWLTQAEQDYQQALTRRETRRKKVKSRPVSAPKPRLVRKVTKREMPLREQRSRP